jgi:hypothetical protein
MIHFTERELIFLCRESRSCECGGYGSEPKRSVQLNFYSQPPLNMMSVPGFLTENINLDQSQLGNHYRSFKAKIHRLYLFSKETSLRQSLAPVWFGELWGNIISDYTKTKLTYDSNILAALPGVSDSIQAFKPGKFLGGLWGVDLHFQLAWHSEHSW